MTELVPVVNIENVLGANEARLNLTWAGNNGDLPDPVSFDASDNEVKGWAAEAIASGYVPGIPQDRNVNLTDFVVERYPRTESRPFNLMIVRPKTPFGI